MTRAKKTEDIMENDGSSTGKHLQTLPQLQATGAEVFGSDGEKVGDLGEVRDSDFTITRGLLKGDLIVRVGHVAEIPSDERVVLDVPSGEVKDVALDSPGETGDPHADFSENAKTERGAWGMSRRKD